MSVKHIYDYYSQICDQYSEMLENLREAEKDAADNMLPPEYVEKLKEMVEPLRINYERVAYLIYLLKQPERPQKQKRYEGQNKKLLESLGKENSPEAIIEENKQAIKNVKDNS